MEHKLEMLNEVNSQLCNPQLRDPLTVALSFMPNPGHFIRACKFTDSCWEHCRYLEAGLNCCCLTLLRRNSTGNPALNINDNDEEKEGEEEEEKDFEKEEEEKDFEFDSNHVLEIGRPIPLDPAIVKLNAGSLKIPNLDDDAEKWQLDLKHHEDVIDLGSGDLANGNLEKLVLTHLPNLQSLADGFRNGGGLVEVILKDCPNVTQLNWCLRERTLETVTIENLPQLREIKSGTLGRCTALKEVNMSNLPELREISSWFIGDCYGPIVFYFGNFPKLETIGTGFLRMCHAMRKVTIENLPSLTEIKGDWLRDCAGLECVKLSKLPKLASIGSGFLGKCELKDKEMPLARNIMQIGKDCHAGVHDLVGVGTVTMLRPSLDEDYE